MSSDLPRNCLSFLIFISAILPILPWDTVGEVWLLDKIGNRSIESMRYFPNKTLSCHVTNPLFDVLFVFFHLYWGPLMLKVATSGLDNPKE